MTRRAGTAERDRILLRPACPGLVTSLVFSAPDGRQRPHERTGAGGRADSDEETDEENKEKEVDIEYKGPEEKEKKKKSSGGREGGRESRDQGKN